VGRIARLVAIDLGTGMRLPQSMDRNPDIFPEAVRNLAEIGDQSGALPKMLLESAAHIERLIDIRRHIRTALIYPVLVFATILGVGFFWLYYVVPNMAQLFKQLNAKLPPLTQWLIAVSDALVQYLVILALVVVVMIIGLTWMYRALPRFKSALHDVLHRVPIARTLMTSSGMAFVTEHLALLVRA